MKVLVTGGTGFTGKALVRRLLDDGYRVVVLDFQEGLKTEELRQWGADVIIGSVTEKEVVDRCMEGVDIVHHLAAAFRQLNVPNSYYRDVNVGGTENVLAAAFREKVKKFVYCSTCGVHGNVENPPGNEDGPINAADYYQQTKYEAEPLVQKYHEKGMETVILRPAAIYGPGDPERFFMIFKRVQSGMFPMFGNGKTLYHPLYISHLVDAHMLAQQEGKGNGQTYLIADEKYLEIEELVRKTAEALRVDVKIPHLPISAAIVAGHICEKLCKPFKLTPPIFPRRVDWFRQNRAFSIEKARKELGYDPRVSIEEGLKKTAEWYKNEGYL